MATEKRGRGRPRKLPEGNKRHVACVLVNGELARLHDAMEASGMSQNDFTRAAVLHAIDNVNGNKPTHPAPKRKK